MKYMIIQKIFINLNNKIYFLNNNINKIIKI